MTKYSDQFLNSVMAALPACPPGLRPNEVWRLVGGWSGNSVLRVLADLAAEGRVGFHGEDRNRRYWRGAAGMPPAAVRYEVVGVRPTCSDETVGRESTIAGFADQDEAIACALAADMSDWDDILVRPVTPAGTAMGRALRASGEAAE